VSQGNRTFVLMEEKCGTENEYQKIRKPEDPEYK
jgi:hypothetical protein